MNEITEGFPLQWPTHWKRTPAHEKLHSRFRQNPGYARNLLIDEIRLLGGKYPIISSNLPLKKDGMPYANYKAPADQGVAVYFMLYGKQQCIPCDKWKTVNDNIVAVQKTISALRGIERWGAKDMVEAAFKGFQALPSPDDIITVIDYFYGCSNKDQVKAKYIKLAKEMHPDLNGNKDDFVEMQRQYKQKLMQVK